MAKEFNPNKTTVVSSINKSDTAKTVIQIHEFDDKTLLDIRLFWKKKEDKKYSASGKGISIPLQYAPSLRKALRKVKELTDSGEIEIADAKEKPKKKATDKKPTKAETKILSHKKRKSK
jgi:hypothetical protein